MGQEKIYICTTIHCSIVYKSKNCKLLQFLSVDDEIMVLLSMDCLRGLWNDAVQEKTA